MTSVETVLLCMAATSRDGLTSILEAGIDEFQVQQFPANLQPTLVVQLREDPSDVELPIHAVEIEVLHKDSEERLALVALDIRFEGASDPDEDLRRGFTIIQVLPLQVRQDGVYRILIRVDGLLEASRNLRIRSIFPRL